MTYMLPYSLDALFKRIRAGANLDLRTALLLVCMVVFGLSGLTSAWAQPVKPVIRIAVQEENPVVFIYHTALPPIGHGFNIYRKNENADSYTKLNQHPVRGVASGTELRAYLGTLYDDIERTTGQTTDNGTLTKLRSDFKTANLLTFIHPEIAEALGRLYIDRGATLEEPATYKIEFVDALDVPTGEVLEQTALLLPQRPDSPTQLRAENQGNLITLYWRYIPPNETSDDKIIRFEAFRIDPLTNQHQRIHEKVILRNNALFEYSLTFSVPTVGQTEQLYVRSIDITGQTSEPSPTLRFDVIDRDAPMLVLDVEASPLSNQRVQVSWRRANLEAPTGDLAGYNVYRSSELNNDASYQKLNALPLSLNESVFNDTLGVIDGSQVYFYRVTALDASGNEGPFSTAAMALVEDHTPPPPPSRLSAEITPAGQVALNWNASLPDDFDTFIVLRRRLDPNMPDIPMRVNLNPVTESEFIDAGEAGRYFKPGATYRYRVLSADQSGNFSEAALLDVIVPDEIAPAAPNGVQAVIEHASRIALFWNPSRSTDVMSYVVYRREAGTSTLIATPVPAFTRRFEDQGVATGTTYEYWVTAADSAGNESAKSEPFIIQMRDFAPPRSVRNVRIQSTNDGQVALHWEPVSAFDMAGYFVYRGTSLTGEFELVSEAPIVVNQWTEDREADTWCYRVKAVDTSGNESRPSLPACIGSASNNQ